MTVLVNRIRRHRNFELSRDSVGESSECSLNEDLLGVRLESQTSESGFKGNRNSPRAVNTAALFKCADFQVMLSSEIVDEIKFALSSCFSITVRPSVSASAPLIGDFMKSVITKTYTNLK